MQVLSVPYALHAKTAESLTSTIIETDPLYGSSIAAGITETDTTNWNNKLDNYTEIQNFADVLGLNNDGNTLQIKNISDPTDAKDAATKAYVDILLEKIERLESLVGVEDPVTDIEGNFYQTIRIGTQVWMTENLKTTKYKDATDIPLVTDNTAWLNLTTGAYCWYDNDEATYGDTYGALYNWHTVNTGNLCPTGWHVPTDAEWTTLTDYLGGESVAGGKLKEIGTTHWNSPNTGATNESGFTALPGSSRRSSGTFDYVGSNGRWWSSTEYFNYSAWHRRMLYDDSGVGRDDYNKKSGLSVRCVRD